MIWNHEWPIAAVSGWAVLDEIAPYMPNDEHYGQMMVWSHPTGERGLSRYHELLAGNSATTPEAWFHELDIRQVLHTPDDVLFSLVGIVGAFSYDEVAGYVPDRAGPVSEWTRNFAAGTLTLVAYDLDAPGSRDQFPAVPEPASLLLLGTGLVGLGTHIRRRRP